MNSWASRVSKGTPCRFSHRHRSNIRSEPKFGEFPQQFPYLSCPSLFFFLFEGGPLIEIRRVSLLHHRFSARNWVLSHPPVILWCQLFIQLSLLVIKLNVLQRKGFITMQLVSIIWGSDTLVNCCERSDRRHKNSTQSPTGNKLIKNPVKSCRLSSSFTHTRKGVYWATHILVGSCMYQP